MQFRERQSQRRASDHTAAKPRTSTSPTPSGPLGAQKPSRHLTDLGALKTEEEGLGMRLSSRVLGLQA